MRQVFQQELSALQASLTAIAQLVTLAIDDATAGFRKSDLELAALVLDRQEEIDRECAALDDRAVELLVTQAPVASDLRLIVTSLRISSSLSRMGDLAQHIANLARARHPERAIPRGLKKIFVEMGKHDTEIAEKLVEVIATHEPSLYDEIEAIDDRIDALHV